MNEIIIKESENAVYGGLKNSNEGIKYFVLCSNWHNRLNMEIADIQFQLINAKEYLECINNVYEEAKKKWGLD